jgi:hypothetical protein
MDPALRVLTHTTVRGSAMLEETAQEMYKKHTKTASNLAKQIV